MYEYRQLQKHLDSLPVGFPRTFTGVEIRLLKRFFAPLHCRAALHMSLVPEKAETIYNRFSPELKEEIPSLEAFTGLLDEMALRGAVLPYRRDGAYSLMPFIVGMYEFQISRLDDSLQKDTLSYGYQGFGLEYLTTSEPQSRVIPVNLDVACDQKIATYDEYRRLIRESEGRIAVLPCICRKASDQKGEPCRQTEEREICLALRDYADMAIRAGEGRSLTVEEALSLADQSLEAGLVLQCSNDRNPQFICACCSCCCGLLGMIKASPVPAAHIGSSYRAEVTNESCRKCGLCLNKCAMEALSLGDEGLRIDPARCIGCGVCVASCPAGSLSLRLKEDASVPPANMEELHERLSRDKSGGGRKFKMMIRIAMKMLKG